jgi:NADH:ubiquinone oxidoreductase subunit C
VTPTVSDLLPPAGIYERQIHDLFGITFEGHPGLKKLMLNEDWPENEHPLRKDWKPNPDVFYGGIKRGEGLDA